MRDYVFVKASIASMSTRDGMYSKLSCGPIDADLRPHWHKVRVVSETQRDLYVLKRDAGVGCEAENERLRLDRKALEEAGEYHHEATEIDFYLWPKRFC